MYNIAEVIKILEEMQANNTEYVNINDVGNTLIISPLADDGWLKIGQRQIKSEKNKGNRN